MNAKAVPSELKSTMIETANDRFKRSFGNWFWGSMIAATVMHFLVFQLWPDMRAADYTFTTSEMEAIELPPEIDIPPPPEQIARPANPVISDAVLDEDITISLTTFEDNPVSSLPPPPTGTVTTGNLSDQPTFTPMTVAPRILNNPDVIRALEREYPSILRDAGIGGTVRVYFFINEQGIAERYEIAQGGQSGHPQLDAAALRVATVFRFSPAQNRDQIVPVWVEFPITFQVRPLR
jgi:TonB family protein